MVESRELKSRIIDISYEHKLSHLGSNLTAVGIIDDIYKVKKPTEPFVLSSGHAGLALYVVLEKYLGVDAEELFRKHGVHPDRDPLNGIDCSTGSLGQGLPIATGMALADRLRNVYCLISDGESAEGSIWESLAIKDDQKLDNLKVYLNDNGFAAYKETRGSKLISGIHRFGVERVFTDVNEFPFLKGLGAHYSTMTESDYAQAKEILK